MRKITLKEKETNREQLFKEVKKAIYGIADVSTSDINGKHIGIGTNLIYNEVNDENVSLCHMFKSDTIELIVNQKVVLSMDKNSPILEAFKELFTQINLDK